VHDCHSEGEGDDSDDSRMERKYDGPSDSTGGDMGDHDDLRLSSELDTQEDVDERLEITHLVVGSEALHTASLPAQLARSEAPSSTSLPHATSPRRNVRVRNVRTLLKPQRRPIASREEQEVQPEEARASAFGPPRKRRAGRNNAAAGVATESDLSAFVDLFGSHWEVSTSWQWNSDRENALQQAALAFSPPIGTLLPTLKLLLSDRAKRVATSHIVQDYLSV
jgi:hypothetical protein